MKGVHEANNNLHMVCVLFYLVVMVALETVLNDCWSAGCDWLRHDGTPQLTCLAYIRQS